MEKPKNCYECMNFCPDKPRDKNANGECLEFGYFVNGRNKACDFGKKRPDLIKRA